MFGCIRMMTRGGRGRYSDNRGQPASQVRDKLQAASEAFEYLSGVESPGLEPFDSQNWASPGFFKPKQSDFSLRERFQPYYKLPRAT
jgi:hypothetical protein